MGKVFYIQGEAGRCDSADRRKMQPGDQRKSAHRGCQAVRRPEGQCRGVSGGAGRPGADHPPVSQPPDHHGLADPEREHYPGSRGVSGKGGAGRLLDPDRGWNLLWKDHFPERAFQLHSCGRTAYYDRGQRGTPDSGRGKSGTAGGKNGQYGRQPGDHHTGSDTDSSADGAKSDCCGRDPGRGGH